MGVYLPNTATPPPFCIFCFFFLPKQHLKKSKRQEIHGWWRMWWRIVIKWRIQHQAQDFKIRGRFKMKNWLKALSHSKMIILLEIFRPVSCIGVGFSCKGPIYIGCLFVACKNVRPIITKQASPLPNRRDKLYISNPFSFNGAKHPHRRIH